MTQLMYTLSWQVSLTDENVLYSYMFIVPSPNVSVSTDPDPLVDGQFLSLVCIANISLPVDISITVTMNWSRNGTALTNGSDFTISQVTNVSYMYTSTLFVSSLSYSDDNNATYNCSVNVSSTASFITGSNTGSDNVVLSVEG